MELHHLASSRFSWQRYFLTAPKLFGRPRRIVTVIEGESMVNDATGLVVSRFACFADMLLSSPGFPVKLVVILKAFTLRLPCMVQEVHMYRCGARCSTRLHRESPLPSQAANWRR